jgi:Haloacid Dehalogenase superfamily, subfamily IB, phosphoserine phosphatase-like/2,3-diketo-5-methylthio-1-phosphopentane phosphatase
MGKVFFIDFDGTITKEDTCCAMVDAFARDGWQELDRLWMEKKLSTKDCAEATFNLIDAGIEDLEKLLSTIEIDDYFQEFLKKCSDNGYKVYILSDGYDFNIKTVLNRYGIDIPYYANKLIYDGRFHIECNYSSSSCKDCGTCKKEIMEKLKRNGDEAIYIGDGYSDRCPASAADMVFAKEVLYDYCSKNKIRAVKFENFADIISNLML